MLDNLYMKPGDKISTYNVDFMRYASQLGWGNSVLCHRYYQGLSNQIQDSIFTREQEKPTSTGKETVNATVQGRQRKRPLSPTLRSKEKLLPPVLPQPPRTRQTQLRQPHPPKTLPLSHFCPPLPRSNLILCRWTSLLSWPTIAS